MALPWLECMASAAPAAGSKPKRSIFLYIPNGVNTLTWQIEKAGTDFAFSTPLASLERHRKDVTVVSGLHHPMVIGKHHNCDKVWLTGANVPGDGGAFRNTVSADQMIAEVQGADTRYASLELAVEGHSLAWSRDGIQVPAERNTTQIFNQLFGVEKESTQTIRRRLTRRGSILDLVAADAKRVNGGLGRADKDKLDEYLTAVRQVERRTQRADSWLNIPKPTLNPADATKLSRKPDMAVVSEYHRLFYDLMVMALRTDSTRVITCMICSESNGGAIPDIGISQTRHGLSHHNGDPEQLRRLTQTDTFLNRPVQLLPRPVEGAEGERRAARCSTPPRCSGAAAWPTATATATRTSRPSSPAEKRSATSTATHVDFNLPKIGKYNVADANGHYRVCSRPVDGDARLSTFC